MRDEYILQLCSVINIKHLKILDVSNNFLDFEGVN